MKKTDDIVVTVTPDGEEALRGKFTIRLKLSASQILAQDALRRQLLGPQPDGAAAEAYALAYAIANVRTRCSDVPSWWKDAQDGLGFEDINVPLTVSNKVDECIRANLQQQAKEAAAAGEDLKAEIKP